MNPTRIRRLIILFFSILIATPALASWQILYGPSSASGVTYTCTAFYRFDVQNHPTMEVVDNGVVSSAGVFTKSAWASATCTDQGRFPGSSNDRYAQIINSAVDPNLPGVEVIACIKAVDSLGTASVCIDAQIMSLNDPDNPLMGGNTSAPIANASAQ